VVEHILAQFVEKAVRVHFICPRLRWWSLQHSSRHPSRWRGRYPFPTPFYAL